MLLLKQKRAQPKKTKEKPLPLRKDSRLFKMKDQKPCEKKRIKKTPQIISVNSKEIAVNHCCHRTIYDTVLNRFTL